MSSRYSPYSIRNVQERRRIQDFLLSDFMKEPVTPLAATCAVCLETYTLQSNSIAEFLMPSNCTHVFCFKCVLNMYSAAMNVPRATIDCPMCKVNVTTWQSFFPHTVVSCKFVKKTGDRVPSCQQFKEALRVIRQRYAADDDAAVADPQPAVLQAQLRAATEETQRLREDLDRQKRAHDIAWDSSCQQVSALQARLADLQAQLDRSEALSRTLANHNRAADAQLRNLRQTVQRLQAAPAPVSVNVEFNERALQNRELGERFRSHVYSVVADMMIEDSIRSLQTHMFGAACLPCNVNIEVDLPFDEY